MVVKVMVTFGVDTPQATIILPVVLILAAPHCEWPCLDVDDDGDDKVDVVVAVLVRNVMAAFDVDLPHTTISQPVALTSFFLRSPAISLGFTTLG